MRNSEGRPLTKQEKRLAKANTLLTEIERLVQKAEQLKGHSAREQTLNMAWQLSKRLDQVLAGLH